MKFHGSKESIFDDFYVCPYLSPECGDLVQKNQGCEEFGTICYTPDKKEDKK